MSQKAPSRIHFIARARSGSQPPHLCGRKGERKGAPGSGAGQASPRGCSPSSSPRRPPGTQTKPKRGPHAQGGHDCFKGLQYKYDRWWAKGRGRDGPPVPPSCICTQRDQGLAAAPRRDVPKVCPGVGARYGFILFYRIVNQASDYG